MLFPLNYRHEIESNIGNSGEPEKNKALEQYQEAATLSDSEDQPIYHSPQTQSQTKALMKANLVMNECFEIDDTFQPKTRTETLTFLIYQFFFYRLLASITLSMM